MRKVLLSMLVISAVLLVNSRDRIDDRLKRILIIDSCGSHINFDRMVAQSTDVVRAKILSSRVEPYSVREDIHTIYAIQILEVFQGNLQIGDEIEIAQLGGETAYKVMVNPCKIPITVGDDLVLFLNLEASFFLANFLHRGAYRLAEELDSAVEMKASMELILVIPEGENPTHSTPEGENPIFIVSEGENLNEFSLTVEELWSLREQ